jgi:hypothetical protein
MVTISLDGVEATWLPDDDKKALARQVVEVAASVRPSD